MPDFGSVDRLPSGRWRARYRHDGRQYTNGTYSTRARAWGALTVVERAIQRGTWTPPGSVPTGVPTFSTYATTWLAGRTLAERTRVEYAGLLRRHIEPTFGQMPITTITPAVVRSWHAALLPGSPTARAHAYALLRTILGTAVADDLIPANPCRIRAAGSTTRARTIRPATLAELAEIVGHLPQRYRLLALLTAWTALRFGEATELRTGDVDPVAGILRVRRGVVWVSGQPVVKAPKSAAGIRDVAVPPHLMPALLVHLDVRQVEAGRQHGDRHQHLVFPAAGGGHIPPSSLRAVWIPAVARAGRPDLRFHDLRHTGAVLAASTGATLAELMSRLGHSTPAAALRYQHAAAGRDRIIADRLSELA